MGHLLKIFQYVWLYLLMKLCMQSHNECNEHTKHRTSCISYQPEQVVSLLSPYFPREKYNWLYKHTNYDKAPQTRLHSCKVRHQWRRNEVKQSLPETWFCSGQHVQLFMSVWLGLCIDSRVSWLTCWLWKVTSYNTGSRAGSIFGVICCWWRSLWWEWGPNILKL